ncbi:DUF222 domain-containing protein [Amycolatopsis sp. H20-H5]|uniref:DUF222 domain-containing protein n=1 Tax=Amycolatopsis sp. H20-H5 TaxID=3046309 RepID=UPI002DBF7E4B|nr:DUF222 domain-containing protein [Amycolatopsis sp. H20-H5]MEC3978849.1 DUF222 domain-containing protein [Amycolatopsis sp. H20-H5]
MSDDQLTAALCAAEAALARSYADMLSLVREADARKLAARSGSRTTATLLATKLRLSTREARLRVTLATAGFSLVDEALTQGLISAAHVKEIHRVLTNAPDSISPEDLAEVERLLVELAKQAPPTMIRKAALHMTIIQAPVHDQAHNTENKPAALRCEFRYWMTTDGQMQFSGRLNRQAADQLKILFLPITEPLITSERSLPSDLTIAERHGDTLAEIIDAAAQAARPSSATADDLDESATSPQTGKGQRSGRNFLDRVRRTRASRQHKGARTGTAKTRNSGLKTGQATDQANSKAHSGPKHNNKAA